ncbi:Asp-tRNA(Asn)/Glu-tRNA(Gln) amidotransferase subunit GatA [Rhodohalobacter sulfatireducens]|uniref:Glutamyl-tRNA(Gln) amidotransferase subunit A n=1 Tax=Rhodohalobacter sulfatireducens TaxID=2911366 RepID=A0ABS9KG45_9BACT|nr:Asp-tRNA(Asn)/Glu-tRNA(Gln) amidotransferase subunit GatA [Rhodohalobacter sulfatireducens]MCG2589832.1 Asp-tRNA(Asn)/Glu-tRNA(Gln) amidotransferase subunit GatA [Rhodohalobacter sulfatireducens]
MKNLLSVQEQLQSGKRKVTDICEEYLQTIKETNSEVNAFVSVDDEDVRKQATNIQQKIDAGTAGKLAGMVIGVKDVICEKGKKVTCASHILHNFESVYDATVIKKLKNEDAILIGRTNMDEFAMGSSTENTIYGPSKNPANSDFVVGGSSGGSAAAVAANMCDTSLGSDTGGSIRQPASYCGVVGLKPTYSRVSRYGLVAYASSFDCIGPFSKNVTDAAILLEHLAGDDPMDNSSSAKPVENYSEAVAESSGKLKIGVPKEYFGEGLDDEIRQGIEDRLKELEKDGAELVPVTLPHMKYGIATYYILATAEASSNLARYDGIRYGHRADFEKIEEELSLERKELKKAAGTSTALEAADIDSPLIRLYKKSRTEGFGTEVKRRIILGTYVLSAGYYDAYYGKAQKVRRLIKQDFLDAFQQVDVIVSPTAPTTAFKLGENQDDPLQMYLNDVYTISANLAGICGISVPAGTHSNGLPYGVQFMGNTFHEVDILRAAKQFESLQS